MQKRVSHPFTLHIQARPWMRGRFHWAIWRRGVIAHEPTMTYETFEEARLAGKGALDQMIKLWLREAAPSEATPPHLYGPAAT
ncbi:hypothetical protein [Methylobacterium durans]|uniref:Uncharacterized protein n=1 Tax=Methylobacterium durans TaxID=2202825 RepID=A0A2U8W3N3_9HYPH|nr:hypothetical protein [Methylobacterium durans]AWN40268.1 hypothetical protein DK389_06610 [Methylobacterium durans]